MKRLFVITIVLLCLTATVHAQSRLGISLQGAVLRQMNSGGDAWNSGLGGLGAFSYSFAKNFDLVGTVGYLTSTYKSKSDVTHSDIIVTGGIRYYLTENDFRPYLTAQTGLFKSNGKGSVITSGSIYNFDSSLSSLGFSGGAGFLFNFGNNWNLDCTASINSGSDTFFYSCSRSTYFFLVT